MNYSGKQIGDILIIDRVKGDIEAGNKFRSINNRGYSPKYNCKCLLCNNNFISNIDSIKRRLNKNCGCNRLQYNLLNRKFGKLLVVEKLQRNKHNELVWLCKCDCGEYIQKTSYALRNEEYPQCKTCAKKQIGEKKSKVYIIF